MFFTFLYLLQSEQKADLRFKIQRCFIPIALLTLSLGTLNNPKTCRMVGLIAHAMPTFVYKFS